MEMQATAFVTGADRGLGLALCAGLLAQGWRVFAGQHRPSWPALGQLAQQFPEALQIIPLEVASSESAHAAAQATAARSPALDMLINNAGVISPTAERRISAPQDYDEMLRLYDVNTLGPLRVAEAFLPLLERGRRKRLCFVSSEAGSIARATRTSWYGYTMSKAALNMGVRIMFNDLRPAGYSFRLYHPGWIRSYMSGAKASAGDMEPEEAAIPALGYFLQDRSDEDLLVMRDWQGRDWPW